MALAVVAAGVAALGLTGGLAESAPRTTTVPAAAIDQVVDGGLFTLAVSNALAATAIDRLVPTGDGNWLLAVAIDAEVVRAEDSTSLTAAATLPDLVGVVDYAGDAGTKANRVVLVRDGSDLGHLQPGLGERLAYIFEVKAGTPVPAQVTVELRGWISRFSVTNRQTEWIDFRPVARVRVPVRNLTS